MPDPTALDRRVDEAIVKAAEKLVQAIAFDDSGLISRDTIKGADELRVILLRFRAKRSA